MNINLNHNSSTAHEMFSINSERAREILVSMAKACEKEEGNFLSRFDDANDGDAVQLNATYLIKDMVSIAASEDEKNYILFNAKGFIDKLTARLKRAVGAKEANG